MIMRLVLTSLWFILTLNNQLVFGCSPAINPDISNDGKVGVADYWLIAKSFGLRRGDPRYNHKADTNCDQQIDQQDLDFVTHSPQRQYAIKPEITGSFYQPYTLNLSINQVAPLLTYSSIRSINSVPFTVHIKQTVQPDNGLQLKPVLNENQRIEKKFKRSFKSSVLALKVGEYDLTTILTILESGREFTQKTHIKVIEKTAEQKTESVNALRRSEHIVDLSFMINQSYLTQLPNASVPVIVSVGADRLIKFKSVTVYAKNSDQYWGLQQQKPGVFSGKLTFNNANYGQCFELYAQAVSIDNEVIKSFQQQTVCMHDQYGSSVFAPFESITHDVK